MRLARIATDTNHGWVFKAPNGGRNNLYRACLITSIKIEDVEVEQKKLYKIKKVIKQSWDNYISLQHGWRPRYWMMVDNILEFVNLDGRWSI